MNGVDRHAFLASAIAGRKVSVHLSATDEERAFSDGQAIFLPRHGPIPNDGGEWHVIAAQALLLAAGSLDASMLRRLVGRRQAAKRYVYLEVLRASRLYQGRLPLSFSQLPELRDAMPLTDSRAASLALAASAQALPEPPLYFGTIRPLIALRRVASQEKLAALGLTQHGDLKNAVEKRCDENDESESSTFLKMFQNPFFGKNSLTDLLNDILGAHVSKGRKETNFNAGSGSEMPIGRIERTLRRGVSAVLSRLPFRLLELRLSSEKQTMVYPEWDTHGELYRHDWVRVEEIEPCHRHGSRDLRDVLQAPSLELRRQLGNMGLDYEIHRRTVDGADLDVPALIDCAIDLHAGHPPTSMNIYRASRRTRRDLAVTIALDISGSTGEQNPEADSAFKKQLQLAYQLGMTLDSLGDTVAMFGFHSWGRKLVRVIRLKGHKERWSEKIGERLALLEPTGYTRIGAAIRHGARLLQTDMCRPNRLLILISDGIAYDQDYEDIYAEEDTRKALAEVKTMGTACICLSVGSSTDIERLSRLFDQANVLAVDEVQQVSGRIRKVCHHALVSISRRRIDTSRHATAVLNIPELSK